MSHRHAAAQSAHPCFITCTALGNTPIFSRPEPAQKVLDLWREAQEQKRLTVYGFVLIEDHLSAIVSAADTAKELAQFRAVSAQQIVQLLESQGIQDLGRRLRRFQDKQSVDAAGQLWQSGGPPEPLFGHAAMQAKIDFMHCQPVKRGYVSEAALYRYSSARNYAGQPGLLPVTTEW